MVFDFHIYKNIRSNSKINTERDNERDTEFNISDSDIDLRGGE